MLQFFRDPAREIPADLSAILSPADGRVVTVERAEDPFLKRDALKFSVFMNVNLAILNLLPVPMLDGGHILLGITEWIRRRPLSEPLIRWVQTAGAVVVLGFLLYVTSFDLGELIRGARKGPVPEKITDRKSVV